MKKIMSNTPDLTSVIAVRDIYLDAAPSLHAALKDAEAFINFYDWVGGIEAEFVGLDFDDSLYVFLFKIIPIRDDVDDWLWVVIGDVPSAYITCDDANDPYEALDGYVGAMEAWVEAARSGTSVADLVPVDVPATPANAAMLEKRLKFIDETILPLVKQQQVAAAVSRKVDGNSSR